MGFECSRLEIRHFQGHEKLLNQRSPRVEVVSLKITTREVSVAETAGGHFVQTRLDPTTSWDSGAVEFNPDEYCTALIELVSCDATRDA